jgi:hypothetical protein
VHEFCEVLRGLQQSVLLTLATLVLLHRLDVEYEHTPNSQIEHKESGKEAREIGEDVEGVVEIEKASK